MKSRKNFKKIEKWLFEYSPDSLAGHIETEEDEKTIGEEIPIAPVDQMAMQLSREMPPIEDEEFVPSTPKELAAASDLIASRCPADQVEFFYNKLLDLLETAVEKSNTPPLADPQVNLDTAIKTTCTNKKTYDKPISILIIINL